MEEREIDLLQIWNVFKSKLIYILLASLIMAAMFFGVSKFLLTPKYKAETSIIIRQNTENNANNNMEINDLKFNQELVNTYSEIIKTRGIADLVIKNLNLDMTHDDFKEMVSVSTKNNTEIFTVSVVDTIPERAMHIANETTIVFKEAVKEIMKIDNVQILDKAIKPETAVSPKVNMNTVLGALVGFMLASLVFILKELMDNTIKSADDITETFDIPVLGVIPDNKQMGRRK